MRGVDSCNVSLISCVLISKRSHLSIHSCVTSSAASAASLYAAAETASLVASCSSLRRALMPSRRARMAARRPCTSSATQGSAWSPSHCPTLRSPRVGLLAIPRSSRGSTADRREASLCAAALLSSSSCRPSDGTASPPCGSPMKGQRCSLLCKHTRAQLCLSYGRRSPPPLCCARPLVAPAPRRRCCSPMATPPTWAACASTSSSCPPGCAST